MFDTSTGNLRWTVGCVYNFTDTGGFCPIASDDADELLDVMSPYGEHWRACALAEFRGAECIDILGGVIELVLYQSHELGIPALPAVVGIKRDDEIRHRPEPVGDLLDCASARPFAHCTLWRSRFALADNPAAFAVVLDHGPEEADVSVREVGMVGVGYRRGFIEEGHLYPF